MADRRADQDPRSMGHRNRTLGMWLVLLTVLGAAAGGSAWRASHVVLEEAPAFGLRSTGYEDGRLGDPVAFTLEEYRGRTVLLDMMAVLCTSCRTLTAEVLLPLHERYGQDPDFAILSIDVWADPETGGSSAGETREELVRLQREEGAPWRHALDTDDVWRKYSATSLPQVFLVDPQGRIVYAAAGLPPLEEVDAAVRASLEGRGEAVPVLQVGLVGAALVAGAASFFSPCSVGLIPAYMGFLLHGAQGAPVAVRARRTLRGGLLTAAGIVTVYALLAGALWALSAAGQGPWMRAQVPRLVPVMGGLLVVIGALMLFGGAWDRVARRLGMGRIDGRRGFYAFGLGYGLAAFGCTGPVFLPILVAGFVAGPLPGFAALLAYTLAVAALVLYAAALVAGGEGPRLRRLLSHTRAVTRVSAVLMMAAGAYLLVFDVRAGGLG